MPTIGIRLDSMSNGHHSKCWREDDAVVNGRFDGTNFEDTSTCEALRVGNTWFQEELSP